MNPNQARLQQSFEAKELACAELEARLRVQQQALEAQQDEMHAERRARSAQQGRASMAGMLWAANPAWQGSFLEDMVSRSNPNPARG